MTSSENLFLLLCWLVSVLSALFLGAVFTDVLLPWLRRGRERREMRRLRAMGKYPAFLRRQAD